MLRTRGMFCDTARKASCSPFALEAASKRSREVSMIVITEEMSPKTMITSAPDILTLKDLSCVYSDLTTIWNLLEL